MNRRYQSRVCELLDAGARHRLLAILSRPFGESRSLWDQVKREPKRSTVPQLKELAYFQQRNVKRHGFSPLTQISEVIGPEEREILFLAIANGSVVPWHP